MAIAIVKELKRKLEQVEAQLSELTEVAASLRKVISVYEKEALEASANPQEPTRPLGDEMKAIIEEAAEPVHYKVIYERLKLRGVRVPGTDPAKNVGAHLSGDSRFVSLGAGLWDIRARSKRPSAPSSLPSGELQGILPAETRLQ